MSQIAELGREREKTKNATRFPVEPSQSAPRSLAPAPVVFLPDRLLVRE